MKDATLHSRISKAFRVRGSRVRAIYTAARRAERFFRDAQRRAAFRSLPASALAIDRARGFLPAPPGSFAETAGIIRDAELALARADAVVSPRGKSQKRFLVNVLDDSTLTLDSPVLRLALREDILAAVSRYLGVVPFLSAVTVFHSDTVEGDLISSQLYHCDGDDATQIKIFVYCTDVDAVSGPLTILDASSTAQVQRQIRYQYRMRLTDDQVRAVVGSEPEYAVVGPAGTSVFVDTSRCLHFGSRVAPDAPPRLVTMVQYQTPYSFMLPTSTQAALPFRRLLVPSLTPLQRLVLGE
jgi:hypothetical protein